MRRADLFTLKDRKIDDYFLPIRRVCALPPSEHSGRQHATLGSSSTRVLLARSPLLRALAQLTTCGSILLKDHRLTSHTSLANVA